MDVSEAKVLVTADVSLRRGKPIPMKDDVDADPRRAAEARARGGRGALRRSTCPMQEGRDVWWHEERREGRRRLPAGAARRRAPALHPLHLRLDGEAEGDPPHHRRLPDRRLRHAPRRSSTSSPTATCTGARPTSAGSPGTPTSSTARSPTACTSVMYEGAPGLPGQGPLVGDRREVQGHDHLHGADGHPRLHQVGTRVPGEARPLVAAAARVGRRADQPEARGSGTTR